MFWWEIVVRAVRGTKEGRRGLRKRRRRRRRKRRRTAAREEAGGGAEGSRGWKGRTLCVAHISGGCTCVKVWRGRVNVRMCVCVHICAWPT
jgi:hypothetical protein